MSWEQIWRTRCCPARTSCTCMLRVTYTAHVHSARRCARVGSVDLYISGRDTENAGTGRCDCHVVNLLRVCCVLSIVWHGLRSRANFEEEEKEEETFNVKLFLKIILSRVYIYCELRNYADELRFIFFDINCNRFDVCIDDDWTVHVRCLKNNF